MTNSINFTTIIDEYKRLVSLENIRLTLSNGDKVKFQFRMNQLPHLLGLHHIEDIPLFYKYGQKQIYASNLLKELRKGALTQNDIDQSKLFENIYETRIQYFTYEHIVKLLLHGTIIEFKPSKIKYFDTKLDKIDYMIWNNLDDGYSHLGIGFSMKDNEGFPNTFFYRNNEDYIEKQKTHNKITLSIKNLEGSEKGFFKIYWENLSDSLADNTHYKKLKRHSHLIGCDVKNMTKEKIHNLDPEICDREFIQKE